MCNPEWEKGVELAIQKVLEFGFDGALGWGSMNLNVDVDFMVRQGYDDYLTDLWSRENDSESTN